MNIETFVEQLTDESDDGHLIHNPYRKMVCRYNLIHYLRHLQTVGVDVMLVGEAPGYRGCALTGIPFTDEVQLKAPENNFALGSWERSNMNGSVSERSANIIWSSLRKYKIIPLLWNAFPFHPYPTGKEAGNRAPTKEELEAGKEYLYNLKSIFGIDDYHLFAVGQNARRVLNIQDSQYCIRHPSYDLKKEFPIQFSEKVVTCVNKKFISM